MKFKSILFLFVLTGILFSSCSKDEEEGTVSIKFKVEYNSSPLVMLDRYDYPAGYKIFFSRFSFFASNIQLVKGTSAIEVNDVEYWNFTNSHADMASALKGMTLQYDKIPQGTYTGLSFGLGVPSSSNSKSPADFDSANPLSEVAEYWESWGSYIFMKTEGKMDPDADGLFDDGFALHLGSDTAFRSVNLAKSFTVENGKTTEIEFVIDLYDMFQINAIPYDIAARPQIHTLEALPHALPLMDNLAGGAIR